MSQSINFRALQWAYEQNGLGVTAKAVLVTFAMHANEHGYSWPGVEFIASTWGMDRKTVRRQIEALLVRRVLYHTKKRCGATGQVKVYRLPKITYESRGKCRPFENDGSGAKESHKSPISGGEFPPNKEHGTRKTRSSSSSTPQNSTRRFANERTPSPLRSDGECSFEGSNLVSEEQREAILYFNDQLVSLGWLPVTKRSLALETALEVFDADDVREKVDAVVENSPDISIPKSKTLVRLLWENY
jgi:hypothetical protein